MKPFLHALRDFLVYRLDLERKSIVTASAWGGWVLARHSFDSNPAFRLLNETAARFGFHRGEMFWGGLLLLGAALQLTGLLTDRDRLRMAAAMLLCATWLLIGLMFFLYNSRGAAAPTYLAFAWATGCLYFQIGTRRR